MKSRNGLTLVNIDLSFRTDNLYIICYLILRMFSFRLLSEINLKKNRTQRIFTRNINIFTLTPKANDYKQNVNKLYKSTTSLIIELAHRTLGNMTFPEMILLTLVQYYNYNKYFSKHFSDYFGYIKLYDKNLMTDRSNLLTTLYS